jgi:hypothetical protein
MEGHGSFQHLPKPLDHAAEGANRQRQLTELANLNSEQVGRRERCSVPLPWA